MPKYRYYYKIRRNAQLLLLTSFLVFSIESVSDDIYIQADVALEQDNTCTVTLYQNANNAPATALTLFLMVDKNAAAFLPMADVAKDSGHYVQLAPSQQESGFLISETLYDGTVTGKNTSCLAIAIYKTGTMGGLQPGTLLSCNLHLVSEEIPVVLDAASLESPASLNGVTCISSASTLDEQPLTVSFDTVYIDQKCDPPDPPQQVKASRCYRDKIIISWEAPENANTLEYKIYRSLSDDATESIPVNTAYITTLTWTNTFDDEEMDSQPSGCSCALQYYYYWVRARDISTGCISNFSAPPARGGVFSR